jgi:GrpB-like predicted nucleotidyltransferase (UPF0157 family)
MPDRLDLMTAEELGKLFPVIISDPDPSWPELFLAEKTEIEKVSGAGNIIRIEHIGSTAVPGLKAKPTIDILLEIPDTTDTGELKARLAVMDYHFIPRPENPAPHMMFVKGYTVNGFVGQAYHVHVRYSGDWDEICFRDYLKMNPGTAEEYGELKVRLAGKYRNDRDGYTEAKTEFIKRITGIARTAACKSEK